MTVGASTSRLDGPVSGGDEVVLINLGGVCEAMMTAAGDKNVRRLRSGGAANEIPSLTG